MSGRIHLPPSGSSEAGKTFGPYRVLEEIARGGQGVVMKARHEQLGTLVALKMLIQQRPKDLHAFQREAKTLASLSHPNLLRVTDLGDRNGIAYIAMEYVEGRSLDAWVAEEGVPPFTWTCRVLAEVAEALEHCHQRGLIHRDIKPANILIGPGDHPIVVDFGLVKRDPEHMQQSSLAGNSMVTKTGELKGTPRYMAPEQANRAKFGDVSPQTDVYALGATLFYLLTGRDPFLGDALVSVIAAVLDQAPTNPGRLNPDAPQALCQLCLRAMAKEQSRRPPSAAAFAAELRQLLETPEALEPAAGRDPPWSLLLNGALALGLVASLAWGASRTAAPERGPSDPPAAAHAATAPPGALDRARLAVARGDRDAESLIADLPAGPAKDLLTLERLLPRLTAKDADLAFSLLVGCERAEIPGWTDSPAQRWNRLARALEAAGAPTQAARALVTAATRLGEADDERAIRWIAQAFRIDAREAAVSGKPVAATLLRWARATLRSATPAADAVRRAREALIQVRLIRPTGQLPSPALNALWRMGGSDDEALATAAQPGVSQWSSQRPALQRLLKGRPLTRETPEWRQWMQRGERKRTFDRLLLVQDLILWQPKVISGWIHLGHAYNAVMAMRASQRAWEIRRELDDPASEGAAYDLATCLYRQGRWAEALPYAQEAHDELSAKRRRNPWFNMLLGQLQAHAKKHAEAIRTLDAIGGALDKHARYWRTRAIALEGLGRTGAASEARARLQQLATSPKGP